MSDEQRYQVTDLVGEIDDLVGMMAEITVEESEFLYMGRIGTCDWKYHELRVDFRDSIGVQRFTKHPAAKIQVQMRDGTKRILVIFGEVTFCANTYWQIKIEEAAICKEGRRAFRQRLRLPLSVHYEGNPYDDCVMEDISLVGIAFLSVYYFAEGMPIKVEVPPLLKDKQGYSLDCVVQRCSMITGKDGNITFRYGCSYTNLDDRQEDRLCRDIFTLQTSHMKR